MRGAFVFDANRCTGCQACELACSIENDLGPDRSWRSVLTFNPEGLPGAPVFHLSLACNHCADAACMTACPALAYDRDDETGAVLLDSTRCIGCRYCSWACPYGAPRFEPTRGVMGKCTFCVHRIKEGDAPACARYCPTGALDYQLLDTDGLSDEIEGMPDTSLRPSIRILPPDRRAQSSEARALREAVAGATESLPTKGVRVPEPAIGFLEEWSLAAFTFLITLLFAGLAGSLYGRLNVTPYAFGAGLVVAAVLSLAHLGRPERAWRAILNLRSSWLSREVASFGLFAGLGLVAMGPWGTPVGPTLSASALLIGLLMLLCVDMVYRPVHRRTSPVVDDGGALLTGIYLAGILTADPWIAAPAGALKLGVAVRRFGAERDRSAAPWLTVARVVLGLLVPAVAWAYWGAPLAAPVIAAVLVGEAIGRAGFYERLRIVSPAREMRRALAVRATDGGRRP